MLQAFFLLGLFALNARAIWIDPPAKRRPGDLPKGTTLQLLNDEEIWVEGAIKQGSILYKGSSRWLVCTLEFDDADVQRPIPSGTRFTVESAQMGAKTVSFHTSSTDAGFIQRMHCGVTWQKVTPAHEVVTGYFYFRAGSRLNGPTYQTVPEVRERVWTTPTLSELRCLFDIKIEVQEGTNPELKCAMGPPGRVLFQPGPN